MQTFIKGAIIITPSFIKYSQLALLASWGLIILTCNLAALSLPIIQFAVSSILVLAVLIANALPPLISSWLVIILTVGGIAGLTFGEWDLNASTKLLLWGCLPLTVWLVTLVNNYLFSWQLLQNDETTLRHYTKHYDAVSKLQTAAVARQLYTNEVHNIQTKPQYSLSMHLTLIHISAGDLAQLQWNRDQRLIKQIAIKLKELRLPSEKLFYLGEHNFLIISFNLNPAILNQLSIQTKQRLTTVTKQYSLPIKQAELNVTVNNQSKFAKFDRAYAHLQRQLETKIVTEYLKGDETNESTY